MEETLILYCQIYKNLSYHKVICFFTKEEAEEYRVSMSGKEELIFGINYSNIALDGNVKKAIEFLLQKYEKNDVLDFFGEVLYIGFSTGQETYHQRELNILKNKVQNLNIDFNSDWEKFDDVLETIEIIFSTEEIFDLLIGIVFDGIRSTFAVSYNNVFIAGDN